MIMLEVAVVNVNNDNYLMCIVFQIVVGNTDSVFNLYGVSYRPLNLLLSLLCIKCNISVSCFLPQCASTPFAWLPVCLLVVSFSFHGMCYQFHIPQPLIELHTWLK
jgi:hypothetical protein